MRAACGQDSLERARGPSTWHWLLHLNGMRTEVGGASSRTTPAPGGTLAQPPKLSQRRAEAEARWRGHSVTRGVHAFTYPALAAPAHAESGRWY